jgi:hypothetical protein
VSRLQIGATFTRKALCEMVPVEHAAATVPDATTINNRDRPMVHHPLDFLRLPSEAVGGRVP